MMMSFTFVTIPVDILIFGTIGFFGFHGFRRGVMKAFASVIRIYLSFIITTLLYGRAALFLQNTFDTPAPPALITCFTVIFAASLAIVWAIGHFLRRLSKSPETGSTLSRIGGIILGAAEGILIVSIVIMAMSFYSEPETQSVLDGAISYGTVKQVAPGIRDFTIGHTPHLRELSSELESNG